MSVDTSKCSNVCPVCSKNLVFEEYPGKLQARCPKKDCKFYRWISLDLKSTERKSRSKPDLTSDRVRIQISPRSLGILGILCIIVFYIAYRMYYSQNLEDPNLLLIKNFKKDFPSQKSEIWCDILSVLEKDNPTVKSITFLHGEDKRTPDCLTKSLISLYSENKNIKREEITFSKAGYEDLDYGFALEHYRLVVETNRILVTDLNTVPGNIARIFHSLCDEVSSAIKPSLFIFTLRFDEKTKGLKPMERANTILKEAWNDLPENEISPLLSRIIKNVVDVVPEKEAIC